MLSFFKFDYHSMTLETCFESDVYKLPSASQCTWVAMGTMILDSNEK
jgi:hypothetical protein